MNNNTAILIGICVVVVCITVVVCVMNGTKSKGQQFIWGSTAYDADAMNSLVGAFQSAAAEGGAGDSLW